MMRLAGALAPAALVAAPPAATRGACAERGSIAASIACTDRGREGRMKALFVTIFMKPEHKQRLLEELWSDAYGSERDEPGCLMFNIAQDDADPNVLHLFEVYRDDAAVEAHVATPHFRRFAEATKDWHVKPFQVVSTTVLYPVPETWTKRAASSRR
jgi:quinol monooxygenase YgiN